MYCSTKTIVLIERLRLSCHVGVRETERSATQTVFVDLSCELSDSVLRGDTVDACVNYATLVKRIRELADSGNRKLLETFAVEIANICFEDDRIHQVTITIRKPHKMPDVEAVGITRIFERVSENL